MRHEYDAALDGVNVCAHKLTHHGARTTHPYHFLRHYSGLAQSWPGRSSRYFSPPDKNRTPAGRKAKRLFVALRPYNTLTRKKEPFQPIDAGNVRKYVRGPTVDAFAHSGSARPVIVFDVLFRLLRHLYGPEHVTYVRNITDVDDKINARAAERGVPIRDITEGTLAQFHAELAAHPRHPGARGGSGRPSSRGRPSTSPRCGR